MVRRSVSGFSAECSCGWESVRVLQAAGAHAHGVEHVRSAPLARLVRVHAEARGSAPARCVDPQETNVTAGNISAGIKFPTRPAARVHDLGGWA